MANSLCPAFWLRHRPARPGSVPDRDSDHPLQPQVLPPISSLHVGALCSCGCFVSVRVEDQQASMHDPSIDHCGKHFFMELTIYYLCKKHFHLQQLQFPRFHSFFRHSL